MTRSAMATPTIRTPQDDDYHFLAALHNAVQEPHFHTTAENLRSRDNGTTLGQRPARLVCEQHGRIVGMATWWQPDFDRDNRYWVSVCLHPDHREDEASAALLDALVAQVKPIGADALWLTVREDYLASYPDPAGLGFHEVHRTFGGGFFLKALTPCLLRNVEDSLAVQGVTLHAHRDLAGDPRHDEKIQGLYNEIVSDKHTAEPTIPAGADSCATDDALWNATFIAQHDNEYIGLAIPERANLGAWNSVLGVHQSWRGKGLGSALQARVLTQLKEDGFEFLNVAGVKDDAGYLAVVRRLGANIEPDWISYEKELA